MLLTYTYATFLKAIELILSIYGEVNPFKKPDEVAAIYAGVGETLVIISYIFFRLKTKILKMISLIY